MTGVRAVAVSMLAAACAACGGGAAPVAAPTGASGSVSAVSGPCGTRPAAPVTWDHVIWIWFENHSFGSIVGSSEAPYTNSLITHCGLALNYHNITHPSLPNYIAAVTGLSGAALDPFTSDCGPSGSCTTAAPNLFSTVPSWKAYEESMPSNCATPNAGRYAVRHNPPPYLTSLAGCSTNDVPLAQLKADLDTGQLPAFSFITPDLCNDTHDCPVATGDAWLSQQLPTILASSSFAGGATAIMITWDEGRGGSRGEACATNATDQSCHVPAIVVSPSTPPGTTSDAPFDHWSLLRTTEDMLGIATHLGQASTAASMRSSFGL